MTTPPDNPYPDRPSRADPDDTFADALKPWIRRLHFGHNREIQLAAQRWLADKHLN